MLSTDKNQVRNLCNLVVNQIRNWTQGDRISFSITQDGQM
jgi:hypothetical protein